MKPFTRLFGCLILNSILVSVPGQGTFQNLNFEAATVPTLNPGESGDVSVSAAFPGWNAYLGTNLITQAVHNGAQSLGGAFVSILGPNYSSRLYGNFTAALIGGLVYHEDFELVPASLAQAGTIPTGINSIMFYSAYDRPEVLFNGQLVPVTPLGGGVSSSGVPYEILGGDISLFAGQTGEFRFSSFPPASGSRPSLTFLDNITFSNQPIPEPSAMCLLGLGALLVGWHSRRSKRER